MLYLRNFFNNLAGYYYHIRREKDLMENVADEQRHCGERKAICAMPLFFIDSNAARFHNSQITSLKLAKTALTFLPKAYSFYHH